jgi:hypothetical protein
VRHHRIASCRIAAVQREDFDPQLRSIPALERPIRKEDRLKMSIGGTMAL